MSVKTKFKNKNVWKVGTKHLFYGVKHKRNNWRLCSPNHKHMAFGTYFGLRLVAYH